MGFDPEDVLNAAGGVPGDPGKGKKSSPGFDPSIVHQAAQTSDYPNPATGGRNLIAGAIDPSTSFNDFRFQPKTNANNYQLRAQDQGFWESLGKTLGNTISNIPLDIIQGVGYLGTLMEMGDDRDYSNALTTEMEKLKNPLGQVYAEHPEKTIDLGDSAWWMNNLGQLAESAASFAVEGAGVAKLFGTAAKAAAWSTRAAKIGAKVAQGLSAATLTYMEGAMSGAQIYETAYNNNYMKLYQQGMDPNDADQQARHIASQAAAATVQLHTALNLALNLTALTPLFREPDQAITQWWRKNGKPLPGESSEQWTARLAEAVPENMPLKKLLGMSATGPAKLGLEAFQEGLEEVNTQYAEHVGRSIGEGKEKKDVAGRFTDIDRYFSEVLNQEGALNMALGALGGLAQTVLLEHAPVHKVVKYGSDGKPLITEGGDSFQTERVSAHTLNERMNRQYFDNIKDALTKDMKWFGEKNAELQDALAKKDLATVARVKADLLSVHNLRAISLGMADMWKQQYEDIAALDNTRSLGDDLAPQIAELDKQIEEDRGTGDVEAMNQKSVQRFQLQQQQNDLQGQTEATRKGFAQNKSDNSYREKALQASQNLDYLTKLYEDMQDKYTGTPEMEQSGLAEHMYYRQANLFLQKQQLDQMQQDLLKLKGRVDEMTLSSQDDILVKQAKEHLDDKEVWETTVKKLNQDITRLNEAIKNNNSALFLKILDKYKIPSTPAAGQKLINLLSNRKRELQVRAEESNKNLNDTIELWKQTNPNGNPADIIKKAAERPVLEDLYQQNKAYHQQALTEYETARDQLAKDSTEKGIRRYVEQNRQKDDKKQQNKDHIEAYNQQLDREIAANMDAKQKQDQVKEIDDRIGQLDNSIASANGRIRGFNKQLTELTGFKNLLNRLAVRGNIGDEEVNIKHFQFERNELVNRRAALQVQSQQATQQAQNVSRTPPPVAPTTQVTPASTPTENTVAPEVDTDTEVPQFDFSQEVIPVFTTVQDGDPVFDRIMGGSEQGATFRQFVQIRKDSSVESIIASMKTMLQKTNQEIPSDEYFAKFITPYLTTLRNQYQSQQPNATEEYENLKSMLKPEMLNVLDIMEGEFRQHGFSYDRAKQILNDQVKQGNLSKHMIGTIMNRIKAHLEVKEDPVIQAKTVEEVQPTDTGSAFDDIWQNEAEAEKKIKEAHEKKGSVSGQLIPTPALRVTRIDNGEKRIVPVEDFYFNYVQGNLMATKISAQKGTEAYDTELFHAMDRATMGGDFQVQLAVNREENSDEYYRQRDIWFGKLAEYMEGAQSGAITTSLKDFLFPSTPVANINEPGPVTYIPPIPDSEPTVFTNASLDTNQVEQQNKVFAGAQNVEVVKANFNTNPYKEFDNGSEVRIVADYTELDPKLNTDLLVPGGIIVNDDVTFEVDENWSGEINFDTEMIQDDFGDQLRRADTFQNYLEGGKIPTNSTSQHPKGAHANVPIRIIHKKTGKTIGYLPRADWVLARYPDTGNYRNVTDQYTDQGEEVTDNVARQYGRIMKLREAIVRAWNTDKSLKLDSKVSKRGTGHVMINRDVNPNSGNTKLVKRSAKNMLPDNSLEIAIIKQGTAYVGTGTASQKQVAANLPAYLKDATSLPVAMLPSPDGTYVPTPLYTHKLGDNPSQLNTLVSVIQLYLRSATDNGSAADSQIISKIETATGFDIRTAEGLRGFVQQYFTYTQKFGEKDTVIMPSEAVGNANPQFMLDIPDLQPGEKASFIKVGTSFSGEKPVYAQLVNNELHPDFEQALRDGLSNRFKNVVFPGKGLRGINSQGEFKAPIIKKDGTVQVNTYSSYNEYVKANSTTFAYGLNKVGDRYVYMANPVVQLDYDAALKSALPVISTSITEATSQAEGDQEAGERDEISDLFGNGMLSPSPGSVTPLPIPGQGEKVSLELLQDLRNITPEAHRNSKTPEQVLRELLERGVTVLADGHNPFYTC